MTENWFYVSYALAVFAGAAGLLLAVPVAVSALQFKGMQTGPGEWTYTLVYDPHDNYAVTQPVATITLRGLSGVTGAAGPTSTTFPDAPGGMLDTGNLRWTAEVLDKGTGVRWTHVGPGTGNFSRPIEVRGFRIFATAKNGPVSFATSGFATDRSSSPASQNRDRAGTVAGPKEPRAKGRDASPPLTPAPARPAASVTRIEELPSRVVSERLIAQFDYSSRKPESFIVSPDNRRLAYTAKAGGKEFVVVDGKEGNRYDDIEGHLAIFSPDSKRVAYGARVGNKKLVVVDGKEGKQFDFIGDVEFSLDSKRVAYTVRMGNKEFVVVDGKEGKPYDKIGVGGGGPTFSPDNNRLAYTARLGNSWLGVVDGREGNRYDAMGERSNGGLVFSPDSKRVAYTARVGTKEVGVVDGKEGKPYDGIVGGEFGAMFSPDSKRVAYVARVGNKKLVVVDGKEGKPYDGIESGGPDFSRDSKRVAYVARIGKNHSVVIDGREGKQYDGIFYTFGTSFFSPDSSRVAFAARIGLAEVVVVDGKEDKPYDGIGGAIHVFSPDSKRVAYGARVGGRWFVVVDGKEGKPYNVWRVGPGDTPIFSLSFRRAGYWTGLENKLFPVVRETGESYIGAGGLVFSPDSKRLAYTVKVGHEQFVVVDGAEGKRYDSVLVGTIVFDSPDRLHYLGRKGGDIYLVEERIK
jgi:Tol biopolymer transport system component